MLLEVEGAEVEVSSMCGNAELAELLGSPFSLPLEPVLIFSGLNLHPPSGSGSAHTGWPMNARSSTTNSNF